MKSLVIFKVGDTFSHLSARIGDFEQWIVDGLGDHDHLFPIAIIDPRNGGALPDVESITGIIITGSHSMVSDHEPWSESLACWLRTAVSKNIPTLGICYGHQLLAHALGGDVGYHPSGIELGTVSVNLTILAKNDLLFDNLPDQFPVHVVHRQSVRRLPQGAVLLASNDFEPHHAFRVGDVAWGVQFHPEFSADAMVSYIEEVTGNLNSAEAISESLSAKVLETEESASVLLRFAHVVRQRINCRDAGGLP